MTAGNPLAAHLSDWLAESNFAVLAHGFVEQGRDFAIVIQVFAGPKAGVHELRFKRVGAFEYVRCDRIRDLPESWGDVFVDYGRWEAAARPDSDVWDTNWSLADPGFQAQDGADESFDWSPRLHRATHRMSLETDRFTLSLVFQELKVERLSADTRATSRVVVPLRRR